MSARKAAAALIRAEGSAHPEHAKARALAGIGWALLALAETVESLARDGVEIVEEESS